MDTKIETLPSEGYLTESETPDGSKDIEEQISDFVIKIGSEIYLLECQSYDDGSMAIRIAEYAFIVARQFATWNIGHATIPMPRFSIIYVKRTDRTPKKTTVTFTFPDGQTVHYESDNVILEEFTKEYIVEKRLFPYIPFYIARYEKELFDDEIVDLMGFVNTIITHITNGNQNEERLVNIMGGTVIETESEKLIRKGSEAGGAKQIIEMGQEFGLDDAAILERLQGKLGLSLEKATAYLEQYGKALA
ncbi:MAG: hypothetical protein PUE95_09730 [Lachnospiraceae bacterium]|nr:hypothetical protein [Lachnospiraceae bacterium]